MAVLSSGHYLRGFVLQDAHARLRHVPGFVVQPLSCSLTLFFASGVAWSGPLLFCGAVDGMRGQVLVRQVQFAPFFLPLKIW